MVAPSRVAPSSPSLPRIPGLLSSQEANCLIYLFSHQSQMQKLPLKLS